MILEQFAHVGEGWCRADCSNQRGCQLHKFKKGATNHEECKKICLGEPGCTGYSTTTNNQCLVYGFIHSDKITGTSSGWTPGYNSYFIPSKTITDPGIADCYRRTKVADLILGITAF